MNSGKVEMAEELQEEVANGCVNVARSNGEEKKGNIRGDMFTFVAVIVLVKIDVGGSGKHVANRKCLTN